MAIMSKGLKIKCGLLICSSQIVFAAYADNLRSYTLGNTTVTEGVVDGKQVRLYSSQMGSSTVTRGSVGGQDYFTSSQPIGGSVYTRGDIGGAQIGISSMPLGGSTISSGHVGDSRYQATTHIMGGSAITRGSLGDGTFSHTSQNIGSTTVTSGNTWRRTGGGGFGSSEAPRRYITTPLDSDYQTYRPQIPARSVPASADQPISFHTGAFAQPEQGTFDSQRRIWEQNAMRRMMETMPRRTYADEQRAAEERLRRELRDSPVTRQMYNEYMRKVGEQYARQYYNTFGSHPNGSDNHSSRESYKSVSYFRWILLFVVIAFACGCGAIAIRGNRYAMKNRGFRTERGAWTLFQGKKAFDEIKMCICWLWGHREKLLEDESWSKVKKCIMHTLTNIPNVIKISKDTIALKKRGKAAIRRICPDLPRVALEGGSKRICKVCGMENSAMTVVCCNCGIAFEYQKIEAPQTKGKSCKSRKGPYSRLIGIKRVRAKRYSGNDTV